MSLVNALKAGKSPAEAAGDLAALRKKGPQPRPLLEDPDLDLHPGRPGARAGRRQDHHRRVQ